MRSNSRLPRANSLSAGTRKRVHESSEITSREQRIGRVGAGKQGIPAPVGVDGAMHRPPPAWSCRPSAHVRVAGPPPSSPLSPPADGQARRTALRLDAVSRAAITRPPKSVAATRATDCGRQRNLAQGAGLHGFGIELPIDFNRMERWQSGRSHRTRNAAYGQPYRGFESLPLRQSIHVTH